MLIETIDPALSLVNTELEPAGHNHPPPWTIPKLSLIRVNEQHLITAVRQRLLCKPLPIANAEFKHEEFISYGGSYEDPRFTTNVIYQCYRPNTVSEMNSFNEFKLFYRDIIPNSPHSNPHEVYCIT
jgi:hypothetical protein